MIKKIANLKGRIDCPKCFSLLEWDNAKDIKVSNGNKYIICPECGQSLVLKKGKDYWEEDNSNGSAIIVNALPEVGVNNTIYLVPDGDSYSAYKYKDGEWVSVSGGGGDFSIANVTFINNTDTIRTLSIALASPAHDGVPDTSHWNTTASRNGGTTELKVILYHGEAIGMIDIPLMGEAYVPPENVTVTGDITMQGNDTVIINGDGTITLS